ncbi:hypothetical protein HF521_015838 [Silurus meridionalis]|uniref:Mucin-1 n=1 Tax=Silurus meridionalis TaxID=175797 RepID=A0A8T0A6D4_SILME|nr:hypothetical protein HF521_015838 [Silurus meridionalis]
MKCWVIWTLCIAVILKTSASAGGESLERAEAMSAEDTFNYNFSFEIMNRIYNNSLQDPQSEDYKNMYKEVSSAFYSVYSCSSCPTFVGYQGVRAMSFRKGSVIANSIIVFKGPLNNPTLIKSVFQNALKNNKLLNGLQINNESLKVSGHVTNTNFSTTTPSSDHGEGVPGWAIALLVLAAIAILLLLIIIIILLVRWCCVDNDDDIRSLPPQEHTPYMRTTFREPLSVPAYSPHTPQKNLYPFEDLTQSPKPKRTGTYVVTPER